MTRSLSLIHRQPWVLGLLAVWAAFPIVALVAFVIRHGGVLTGASGADSFDQMQYLAWIRDMGAHGLASNLWHVAPTPHDYLQPMWFISGMLWRVGASIPLAYLVWKPVAVLVVFLGIGAYVAEHFPESRIRQACALVLAVFYKSPLLAIASWTGLLSSLRQYQLVLAGDDAYIANTLYGLEQTALAVGLMPVCLLAAERLIRVPERDDEWQPSRRRWLVMACLAGLMVSWLHPWQGAIVLGVLVAMALVVGPRARYRALVVPALATALPLLYGVILARSDPSWRTFQSDSTIIGTAPAWALLATLGPLAALATLGLRRPRDDRGWMLVLWLAVTAAVYLVVPEFPSHALAGVTLPLAVLAVRGWSRLPWPRLPRARILGPALAALGLAAFAGIAAAKQAQGVVDELAPTEVGAYERALLVLSPDQAAAISYLARSPAPGAVLAPQLLSMTLPGLAGRRVYAGHGDWQPATNAAQAGIFFGRPDPGPTVRRQILARSGASFLITNCNPPPALVAELGGAIAVLRRYGCVTVYRVGR